MIVTLVLSISVLLQFIAAIFALRLIRVTEKSGSWLLIAIAIMLMGIRRCITLFRLISGDLAYPPDLAAELVALVISVLMVLGIAWIAPLFRSIKNAEEKYRTLAENINVGLYRNTLGSKGKFIEANPAIIKMFGYKSKDEFLSMSVADLYQNPGDRKKFNEKMLRHGFVKDEELQLKKKDGTFFIGSVSTVLVKDEKGDVKYYDGIIEDITERKRAEKRIKHLNSVLRAIRNVNQLIIKEKDKDSLSQKTCNVLIEARSYDAAWLGLLKDDKTFEMVKGAGFKQDVSRFCEYVMGGGHLSCIKKVLTQKDFLLIVDKSKECGGCLFKDVCVSKEVAIIRVEYANRLFGLLALLFASDVAADEEEKGFLKEVAGDIAVALYDVEVEQARKRAEEALRESEARFSDIVENALEWIWEVDVNGKYTYVSSVVEKILGYKPDEVIGKHFYTLFHPEDQEELKKAAFESFTKKQPFREFVNRNVHKNGKTVWLSTSAVPILDNKGNLLGYRGADIDITERKRAEQDIKKAMEKLQNTLEKTVNSLASAVGKRDPYTASHQQRVTQLVVAIAEAMGFSKEQIKGIRIVGLLHDIGKISVPAEILSKPTKLTPAEFGIVKEHSKVGYEILKSIDFPWPVAEIVLQHHERINGSGYPQGLLDKNILLETKILGVADVVEAMCSHRPYRPAFGVDKALKHISQNKGSLFAPEVVDVCVRLFKEKGFRFE